MKLLMILGGLFGFLMGMVLGIIQDCAWPNVFWRASVAALLAGVVMRWWGRIWIRSLLQAHRERDAESLNSESTPVT